MGKKRKEVSSARANEGLTAKPLTRACSPDTSKPPTATAVLRNHSADALWGRVREVAHEPSFPSDFPRLQRASSGLKRASTAVAQAHAEVLKLADHPTTHLSCCPSRSPSRRPLRSRLPLSLPTAPLAHHCPLRPPLPLALTTAPCAHHCPLRPLPLAPTALLGVQRSGEATAGVFAIHGADGVDPFLLQPVQHRRGQVRTD